MNAEVAARVMQDRRVARALKGIVNEKVRVETGMEARSTDLAGLHCNLCE